MARHLQSLVFWVDMDHSMYTGSRWCGVNSVDTPQRIGPTRTRKDLRRIGPLTVTHEVQHIILGPFRLLGSKLWSIVTFRDHHIWTLQENARTRAGHASWHVDYISKTLMVGHDRGISIHFKSFSEVNVYNLKSIGLKVLYKTYVWM